MVKLRYLCLLAVLFTMGCSSPPGTPSSSGALAGVAPPRGKLYHGVFPGSASGDEDDITSADVASYEHLVGQPVAWVYFSQNWFNGRAFPTATANWIRARGSMPFIRLMMLSQDTQSVQEPLYTLDAICNGAFDADLTAWGQAARAYGSPLLVEYGTECNGSWFPWNAQWNGAGANSSGKPNQYDGPTRFIAAYRHIVQVMRAAGASNITWVFHINVDDDPDVAWNRLELYYPGDDVVDWCGVSCYGPQTPTENWTPISFRAELDDVSARLAALAPTKPIAVLEFGCAANHPLVQPDAWAGSALDDLLSGRWPNVIGFAWWNSRWENDNNPLDDSIMDLQDLPALATVFQQKFSAYPGAIQTVPVFSTRR